jgi:hypothetical protein
MEKSKNKKIKKKLDQKNQIIKKSKNKIQKIKNS